LAWLAFVAVAALAAASLVAGAVHTSATTV